jgi:hypothetical protein
MYHFHAKFFESTPHSWDGAKRLAKRLLLFAFRGHSEKEWRLATTIERLKDRWPSDLPALWEKEKQTLQAFKARAHHFLQSPPKDTDLIEWLSIIQDYGGPTRLLDFTESFYIASFFALESATTDACVWAVNNVQLVAATHVIEELDFEDGKAYPLVPEPVLRYAESFITDSSRQNDMVLRVSPPRLNERVAIQKGLFLFPCNITRSFEYNLCKSFGFPFEALDSSNATPAKTEDFGPTVSNVDMEIGVVKINLPRQIHKDALLDLYSMNIDAASLFPGLDGFARSLSSIHQPVSVSIVKNRQSATSTAPSSDVPPLTQETP